MAGADKEDRHVGGGHRGERCERDGMGQLVQPLRLGFLEEQPLQGRTLHQWYPHFSSPQVSSRSELT